MKFGLALHISPSQGMTDSEAILQNYAIADLAEPFGFDSLFVLEHHFSSYGLSPSPLQTLAYFAGRTKRILLGTGVIVLPWNDPVKIAEQIAVLDIISGSRCIFGFGRGTSKKEFDGFGIPMSESSERYIEAVNIIKGLLFNDEYQFQGKHYQIPLISIRPKPIGNLSGKLYGSSMSDSSSQLNASLGLGMLLSIQRDWLMTRQGLINHHNNLITAGYPSISPIALIMIFIDESRDVASRMAVKYMAADLMEVNSHYQFSEGKISSQKGYSDYVNVEDKFREAKEKNGFVKEAKNRMKYQIVGNPYDCIEAIKKLTLALNIGHFLFEFAYGNMPMERVKKNITLFSNQVIPAFR